MSQPTEHHVNMTTTDPGIHDHTTGAHPRTGETPPDPGGYSGREKAGILIAALILLGAVILLGAAWIRSNNQHTNTSTTPLPPVSSPSASPSPASPSPSSTTPNVAAIRAADEAAAVAAEKKIYRLFDLANKRSSASGLGLEKLETPAQFKSDKNYIANSAGIHYIGTPTTTFKARSWRSNPGTGTEVDVVSCTDQSKTKAMYQGKNVQVGPDGKPSRFIRSLGRMAKTTDGRWIAVEGRVLKKGGGATCSLDGPY